MQDKELVKDDCNNNSTEKPELDWAKESSIKSFLTELEGLEGSNSLDLFASVKIIILGYNLRTSICIGKTYTKEKNLLKLLVKSFLTESEGLEGSNSMDSFTSVRIIILAYNLRISVCIGRTYTKEKNLSKLPVESFLTKSEGLEGSNSLDLFAPLLLELKYVYQKEKLIKGGFFAHLLLVEGFLTESEGLEGSNSLDSFAPVRIVEVIEFRA
ncbi:24765_t:CDS:2 [Dentiscutata erythropus]|uniref:24765_t:CDS:1 n=1 Tax=Dentiscutata erythropus TaxID=1348616 RepID=A0A9N8YPW5_9GLOM|nr:24765_t:CDS:2 [Dentiscutata erythropus]